jgi:hypothetical protein
VARVGRLVHAVRPEYKVTIEIEPLRDDGHRGLSGRTRVYRLDRRVGGGQPRVRDAAARICHDLLARGTEASAHSAIRA